MTWTVFLVSESTGITAEHLGHSLLSQFTGVIDYKTVFMPYIDSVEKAEQLAQQIAETGRRDGRRPIVIATMAEPAVGAVLQRADCLYLELFNYFVNELSKEFRVPPSGLKGLAHGINNSGAYDKRISAINYALANDDGRRLDHFDEAEVILMGVSRAGKTPTSLYLAMQFGLHTANYPLTDEDFEKNRLPDQLVKHRSKLIGLTINPERLQAIRQERRPNSHYSKIETCRHDVQRGERIIRSLGIPIFDTTNNSIEEISARIKKLL